MNLQLGENPEDFFFAVQTHRSGKTKLLQLLG
jgi:hypothetical protein